MGWRVHGAQTQRKKRLLEVGVVKEGFLEEENLKHGVGVLGISRRDGAGTAGLAAHAGRAKEVSSVRGRRHAVKSLEMRPGSRRVVTTKGPDTSLRSSIYSHNKHLLSTYCMLGTVSHAKHIDKSDGK